MLTIARRLADLSFSQLMEVYQEGNAENGMDFYPEETPERQRMLAEQDFYDYLNGVFFRTEGATYFVWTEAGRYVSALRVEPYQDGFLLEALETAPDQRSKGYAKALIREVLAMYGNEKIYSHVSKRNIPSRRTHERCGFQKILDHAVYADGSVLHTSLTYCHAPLEKERDI